MEENKIDVTQDSSPETVETQMENQPSEVISEDVKTPKMSDTVKSDEKVVPYERFKAVNDELSKLKKQPAQTVSKPLDVEDYIDISASLEGLDQKEKEKLAREHKLTGKPLSEIRKDEDFLLWQSAYKQKLEKERTLAPSSTQTLSEKPLSLTEKLAKASLTEKEEILAKQGLWKSPRPNSSRTDIGVKRVI